MIDFKAVRFKNFFNFGNDFTELKYTDFDFCCVTGDNGAGKSSVVIEPIYFALFGKPFRKINKAKVVNNINKSKCEVHLWFSKNKDDYVVIRGIKPDKFEIHKNGKILESKSSNTELQNFLEDKILQFNEKIFKQVCLFGSALYIPFLDLSLADRRFVIENILDLQIFSQMQIVVKDKIKLVSLKVNEVESKIDYLNNDIATMQKAYNDVKKHTDGQIQEMEQSIEGYEMSIEQNEIDIKELDEKEKPVFEQMENIESKIKKLNEQIEEGRTIHNKKEKKAIELDSKIMQINIDLGKLEGKEQCPTCGSKADNFKDLLNEWKVKKKKLRDEYTIFVNELLEIENIINGINKKINIQQVKYAEKTDEKFLINKQKAVIDTKIKNSRTLIDGIKVSIDKLKNNTVIDINEIVSKENESKEKEKILKELNEQVDYLNIVKELTSDAGIKKYIIDKYIPIINKRINYYLNQFDLGFNFEFDNLFNDKIISRVKAGIEYNGCSQGQKSRINNAIMFTFIYIAQLLNSVSTNILFMDEVLDSNSLDESGVQSLIQETRQITQEEKKKVLVISHNETTKNSFNQHIRVSMNGVFGKLDVE